MNPREIDMPGKNLSFYAIKTIRISGWLLLPLTLLCIVSGFAMNSSMGLNNLLDIELAQAIHLTFIWPLSVVVLLHSAASVYMAMRRWGWIGRRKKI
jgi:hypothetical protein